MSNFIERYENLEDKIDDRNAVIRRNKNYFGLYLRGLVSWRASLFSRGVMNLFHPAIIDQGLSLAESSFDNQFFRYLEDAYYIPVNGSVYYAGIGVSVALNDTSSDYKTTEGIAQWTYYLDNIVKQKKDINWCKANREKSEFFIKPSATLFISILYLYLAGMLFSYRITIKHMKSFFAPMVRRVVKWIRR